MSLLNHIVDKIWDTSRVKPRFPKPFTYAEMSSVSMNGLFLSLHEVENAPKHQDKLARLHV
ncbi:hypothetical protein CHH80_14390 [Bacillus sp. 7504-2]|nr:hypothetical protein CHH80_14390 [Bacillus sp. 7504-2]